MGSQHSRIPGDGLQAAEGFYNPYPCRGDRRQRLPWLSVPWKELGAQHREGRGAGVRPLRAAPRLRGLSALPVMSQRLMEKGAKRSSAMGPPPLPPAPSSLLLHGENLRSSCRRGREFSSLLPASGEGRFCLSPHRSQETPGHPVTDVGCEPSRTPSSKNGGELRPPGSGSRTGGTTDNRCRRGSCPSGRFR